VQLLPGLRLTDDTELLVAAGAGDRAVQVGRFQMAVNGPGVGQTSGAASGSIHWDAGGLAQLRGDGTAPALVWLAVGRSLRTAGPVDLDPGRILTLDVGGRWTLAPSTSGRAMLVPGRGLRIRAAQAVQAVRRSSWKSPGRLTRGRTRDSMGT
jgi:hypothetical protein